MFASVHNSLVIAPKSSPTLIKVALGGSVVGSVNPLFGRSVLIVEDEPLIALGVHNELRLAGASIIAATNIKDALELIAYAQICAAIVDVKLGGCDCSSVCRPHSGPIRL